MTEKEPRKVNLHKIPCYVSQNFAVVCTRLNDPMCWMAFMQSTQHKMVRQNKIRLSEKSSSHTNRSQKLWGTVEWQGHTTQVL